MYHPYMHHLNELGNIRNAHQHRFLATDAEQKLQFSYINWIFCTNAFSNRGFTPMNSLVPNNTVFLAGYPTYKTENSSATCRDKTITRIGTITTGRQTVFHPLFRIYLFDYDDDWKLGICANSTNETLTQRLDDAEAENVILTNATFLDTVYYDIDGKASEPVYLYDTTEYHLLACKDNRTTAIDPDYEGDSCDAEPFQAIEGLDVYPILGWYGIDIRDWVDGETHVYEFGSIRECITAKYILTAKAAEVEVSSMSKGTSLCQCGTPFWWWFCIWMLSLVIYLLFWFIV
jgi:hypothetical protein